jgi:hypothetical protein
MANNRNVDSESENKGALIDEIKVENHKTANHYVFSVYRGNRNWKRLSCRTGPKKSM